MNISQAAKNTGLNTKTIRYYESVGLIDAPPRLDNGYRDYREKDIRDLKFLRQARLFGFSLEQCRQLLLFYQNPNRRCSEVNRLVVGKLDEIDQHIAELLEMKHLLIGMVEECPNDDTPDCTIIAGLASRSEKDE